VIIITGSILAKPGTLDALRDLSLEHVRRSRLEPGCLSHDVHVDVENHLRLFFFETWRDRDAVTAHFAVPASREFVRQAGALADGAPAINIYEVERAST
jgi:quinol monooxygenase YgiN